MIITVAGPDKVSNTMFESFILHVVGRDVVLGRMHFLMAPESVKTYLDGIKERPEEKILLSFYAPKKANADPLKILPQQLIDVSDLVIWMNLYSTDWVVVKDTGNLAPSYQERWKRNIDRINSYV